MKKRSVVRSEDAEVSENGCWHEYQSTSTSTGTNTKTGEEKRREERRRKERRGEERREEKRRKRKKKKREKERAKAHAATSSHGYFRALLTSGPPRPAQRAQSTQLQFLALASTCFM